MRCSFEPYEGAQKYLFVSYSHQDAKQVYSILEYLYQQNMRIWYDGGIEWGDEWPKTIARHLSGSHVCLAFHSAASVQSERCREELYYARKQHVPVLSIYLENVELDAGLDMQLSSQQALYLNQYKTKKDFYASLYTMKRLQECSMDTPYSFRSSASPGAPVSPPKAISTSVPRVRLIGISGKCKDEQFWIADHTSIGRDSSNRIVLSDMRVSRKHCLFLDCGSHWEMQVLGGNGIQIDNQLFSPPDPPIRLSQGMVLTLFDEQFRIDLPV